MAAVYLSLRFETYVQSSREHPQESYNVSFPFNTHFSCFESLFPSIVVFCREVLFFFLNIRYWEPIFVFHTYGRGRHDQSYWRRMATGVASVVVIYCFSFFSPISAVSRISCCRFRMKCCIFQVSVHT